MIKIKITNNVVEFLPRFFQTITIVIKKNHKFCNYPDKHIKKWKKNLCSPKSHAKSQTYQIAEHNMFWTIYLLKITLGCRGEVAWSRHIHKSKKNGVVSSLLVSVAQLSSHCLDHGSHEMVSNIDGARETAGEFGTSDLLALHSLRFSNDLFRSIYINIYIYVYIHLYYTRLSSESYKD